MREKLTTRRRERRENPGGHQGFLSEQLTVDDVTKMGQTGVRASWGMIMGQGWGDKIMSYPEATSVLCSCTRQCSTGSEL